MRWRGDFILPRDEMFESYFLSIVQSVIAETYLKEVSSIYEFGCGPCHNLLAFSRLAPGKEYFGYDWSIVSEQILTLVDTKSKKYHPNNRFYGGQIDLFSPKNDVQVKSGSAVLTFGSMEQIGSKFQPFFEFLLAQPANVFIHVEPFSEFRRIDKLLGYLSDKYARKRNYLNGYLEALRNKERDGQIELLETKNIIGNTFFDSWCLVVWRHNAR